MAKKKEVPRCEVCGTDATHYVLDTDCLACDNAACVVYIEHEIQSAVTRYEEQEEFEKGRAV